MDISRPCQPDKLIPLLPWPGFDPSFSGHNGRRAIISEWTRLRLRPLSHRGWLRTMIQTACLLVGSPGNMIFCSSVSVISGKRFEKFGRMLCWPSTDTLHPAVYNYIAEIDFTPKLSSQKYVKYGSNLTTNFYYIFSLNFFRVLGNQPYVESRGSKVSWRHHHTGYINTTRKNNG